MTMTDPISDLLTRIRNGQQVRKGKVSCPLSNLKISILKVLKEEGYIKDYYIEKAENNKIKLKINLKYFEGDPVIKEIKRISKPGRRVYSRANSIPRVMNGLGLAIVKHIINRHRGLLIIESELKVGSKFSIYLKNYKKWKIYSKCNKTLTII